MGHDDHTRPPLVLFGKTLVTPSGTAGGAGMSTLASVGSTPLSRRSTSGRGSKTTGGMSSSSGGRVAKRGPGRSGGMKGSKRTG